MTLAHSIQRFFLLPSQFPSLFGQTSSQSAQVSALGVIKNASLFERFLCANISFSLALLWALPGFWEQTLQGLRSHWINYRMGCTEIHEDVMLWFYTRKRNTTFQNKWLNSSTWRLILIPLEQASLKLKSIKKVNIERKK